MFQRTPLHPQLIIKSSPQKKAIKISRIMKYLNHYLEKDTSFLEVGPDDCSLFLEVAKHVKKVFAADVSNEIVKDLPHSGNFTLILSDGCKIPLPADSIDVVFSNQLMEHLHTDDAFDQLRNIFNVLNTGGVYLCVTPNRLN